MAERVLVAMSGGVDSAVAAGLLREQGYEVLGATMRLWPEELCRHPAPGARLCCSVAAVEDARRVAAHLGIRHYVLDLREVFQCTVIDPFCRDYAAGRTPNPCINCNRYVKFGALLERARQLGARWVATGHYARVRRDDRRGRWLLLTGVDRAKDQSYTLYGMTQQQLGQTLLPVGEITKSATRERARQWGLPVAERPESQDICFIVDERYPEFVRRLLPQAAAPGPVLDTAGRQIGEHQGIINYTIGQRRRLGLTTPRPRYVVAIDASRNAIVVGGPQDLFRRRLRAGGVNLIGREPWAGELALAGKIRYNMTPQPCRARLADTQEIVVTFTQPQRAITPGQAVVVYEGEIVVAGAVIEQSLGEDEPEPATTAAAGGSDG